VLLGNGAQDQLQLGNYGDMLDMAYHYVESRGSLQPEAALQLAEATDHLCRIWRLDDASIWELSDQQPYTQGKLACWLALDRAILLAEAGQLPAGHLTTWKRERESCRRFITGRCWSEAHRGYARAADGDELDAAVLLAARGPFLDAEPDRLSGTIDAVRRELGAGGPLLYRYTGMQDEEGAFLACSFWAAEALARAGRVDEAGEMMDELVGLANDVGLYSEEMDPSSHAFLGNVPQALTHLALVNAAFVIADRQR
jgi:GH15 family glucan-1,4-alpha-glucosidase